jgi:hypothetical protein
MLKSEQNTRKMEVEVSRLESAETHENLSPCFEHGQWWVTCGACGASWSVIDTNRGLDLEEVDSGDGSCAERDEL